MLKSEDMKNINKLERLKTFLKEQGIEYATPSECSEPGSYNLSIPAHRVFVKVTPEGEEDDQVFFNLHKHREYPVFIRTADTPKFVIEKVQNTIIKSMLKHQEAIMAKREREAKKAARKGEKA